MFAIVDIAGFQEKVSEGEKLSVPTLSGEPGSKVVFENVFLLAKSDSDIVIGTPTVPGASVEATVIAHGRADKIRVVKMKRRKRYRRVHGHRQGYTDIEVTKISTAGSSRGAKNTEQAETKTTKTADTKKKTTEARKDA